MKTYSIHVRTPTACRSAEAITTVNGPNDTSPYGLCYINS